MSYCSRHDRALFDYAIGCALSALIGRITSRGGGWYHFADGEIIIAAEVAL